MRWVCKICNFKSDKRIELLKHYRLKHGNGGRSQSVPCLHTNCPCSFKTFNALRTHLTRQHVELVTQREVLSFRCQLCCSVFFYSEKQYFEHLGGHLRRFEVVACVFKNCNFSTNIYSTFATHRHRKHASHSLEDFKTEVLKNHPEPSVAQDETYVEDDPETLDDEPQELSQDIKEKFGHLFLKLESTFNVPNKCIDEIVDELQFISCCASGPVLRDVVESTLKSHNCDLDSAVISDLVKNLCESHPISTALGTDGPFTTSYKRRQFMKKHFSVVEPEEHILDKKEGKTFQYVPILQSLVQVLNNETIQGRALGYERNSENASQYQTFRDGCNPLGTSRKKHKVTAVYWVIGNIPAQFRSILASIYLAILCKAEDTKQFGFQRVLEPLLRDLQSLEKDGLLVSGLGKVIKGTVVSVVADNLGAHSVAGFVENFTGSYFCRFCLGDRSDVQSKEVRCGGFQQRTKEQHTLHVQTAVSSPNHTPCYGVKKQCALSEKLDHFHVTSGYPPDVLHDLLEGIVPMELALSFDVLVKKRYFSLMELNHAIRQFPYKWSDKTNCPHQVPVNFAKRRSVGGNAHENWCLLRLLPLIIGLKVPEHEPVWQMLMTLKDIVDLAMSPVHTEESICYLESMISEQRSRFLEAFPQQRLLPKHHFLEHYPQLIREFGPVAALWTMRFEAKHSFFKRVVRQTGCFRNILLSLANKHQLMIAYHESHPVRSSLLVTKTTEVSLDVLRDDLKDLVKCRFPAVTTVHVATNVSFLGTNYAVGMLVCCGSTAGLPDFAELLQIMLICDKLTFFVRLQNAWYNEHLRSYELENTGSVQLLEHKDLKDFYPLAAYTLAGRRLATLKHHICTSFYMELLTGSETVFGVY